MAKKLHGYTSAERAKQIAINNRVLGGGGSQAPRARRRRGRVGGGSGTRAIYGKIDTPVSAGGFAPDAIDAYYRASDGTFQPLLDESDVQVRYGAHNMNSFSDIAIYEDPADSNNPIKVFVWGFPFTYDFGTEEEPDVQTVMEIWNPPTELALYDGYVKNPANSVGQVPMHRKDSNKTIVSAGPCGGT